VHKENQAEGEAAAEGGATEEGEKYRAEPEILPLPPAMAKLGPGQGLGCEAAEGSLVPSRKREYKPCGKHTEGKRPLYAIGFNFMDARYYDVFATVGGNRVSHRLLPLVVLFCFFLRFGEFLMIKNG
jgi:polycomb protein EED